MILLNKIHKQVFRGQVMRFMTNMPLKRGDIFMEQNQYLTPVVADTIPIAIIPKQGLPQNRLKVINTNTIPPYCI
jgi:hypothetical protein